MTRTALATLAVLLTTAPGPAPAADGPSAPLRPLALEPLPLGAIRPAGWLQAQLRLQADGLSGHLDEFWPDIRDSAWFGGDREGWERVPYWLDGLVPLAYLLDDPALRARVEKAVGHILDTQHPDGWLGPIGDNNPRHKPYDVWPLFPLLKALAQYHEATGDPRVVPAMLRAARKIQQVVDAEPMYEWARFRVADLAVSLFWLDARTGGKEPWLLDLARTAFDQSHDWMAQYDPATYSLKDRLTADFSLATHGVNTGMALKYGPVRWRLTGTDADRAGAATMLGLLDRYHGQATGLFTCDEHLAGRSPSQGTELCTVVEAVYALQHAAAATGDVALLDRLERIAFNAMPATFKKDMTAHQYDQQTNQVICTREGEHVWATNGPESNLYGLEPNFGCCTANMHQGWPKFTAGLWMRTPDGGLAATSYAPCVVETEIRGKKVHLEVKTDYPFRDDVTITFRGAEAVDFPLHLRIPAWSTTARIAVEAADPAATRRPDASGRDALRSVEGGRVVTLQGTWRPGASVTLQFDNPPRLFEGFNGARAITRGPLVFALPIDVEWKKIVDRPEGPFDDWEALPKSPWNYALALDEQDPSRSITFEDRPMPEGSPFRQEAPPVVAKVNARRLPGWTIEKSAAQPPPPSPVTSDQPEEPLALIPYGATDLRVTEFPILEP
jgi:hypothetical protein